MTDANDIPPMGHPLQQLGARLADLLDDDQWKNIEPMLLDVWQARAATPAVKPTFDRQAYIDRAMKLAEEYRTASGRSSGWASRATLRAHLESMP